jgi:hypothetical protein
MRNAGAIATVFEGSLGENRGLSLFCHSDMTVHFCRVSGGFRRVFTCIPSIVRFSQQTQRIALRMAIKPSHRGVCVGDCEQSLRFYRDGLGFAEAQHFTMDDPALSTVMEVEGSRSRTAPTRTGYGSN